MCSLHGRVLALTAGRAPPSIARDPTRRPPMDYADYQHLLFDRRPNGVVLITINRPEVMNATNARLHWELTQVWRTIDADPAARVALVTGAGRAFSAGGDISLVEEMAGNAEAVPRTMRAGADLVSNITAETARFTDGHTRLGVAAGDHAAIIWPLLCGMAKAKYYLLTSDFIDGREAERIGLVSRCVPADKVMETALGVAEALAGGSQHAIRFTKRALNNWLRQAGPIFDQSLALEMLCFGFEDVKEGARAIREKRAPSFPSAR